MATFYAKLWWLLPWYLRVEELISDLNTEWMTYLSMLQLAQLCFQDFKANWEQLHISIKERKKNKYYTISFCENIKTPSLHLSKVALNSCNRPSVIKFHFSVVFCSVYLITAFSGSDICNNCSIPNKTWPQHWVNNLFVYATISTTLLSRL